LLLRLRSDPHSEGLWSELFENLYHQGDVGETSFAAVSELARLLPEDQPLPWQLISLVHSIEEARLAPRNPELPIWIANEYFAAIKTLARRCLLELQGPTSDVSARSMIAFVALWKGLKIYAKAIGDYSEDELKEYLPA
jgi:hypothetical protein